jgi:hypothetical protein
MILKIRMGDHEGQKRRYPARRQPMIALNYFASDKNKLTLFHSASNTADSVASMREKKVAARAPEPSSAGASSLQRDEQGSAIAQSMPHSSP